MIHKNAYLVSRATIWPLICYACNVTFLAWPAPAPSTINAKRASPGWSHSCKTKHTPTAACNPASLARPPKLAPPASPDNISGWTGNVYYASPTVWTATWPSDANCANQDSIFIKRKLDCSLAHYLAQWTHTQ